GGGLPDALDHRQHPGDLLLHRDLGHAGDARLPADVDDPAPWATWSSASATRSAVVRVSPRSENESGLALTMPMSTGSARSSSRPRTIRVGGRLTRLTVTGRPGRPQSGSGSWSSEPPVPAAPEPAAPE